MSADLPRYRYLNHDGEWPDFKLNGMDVGDDGVLRLDHLPRLAEMAPAALAAMPVPGEPAGIAALPDGCVFYSDPSCHRLLWLDGCDEDPAPLPCIGGPSDMPGGFQHPRGMTYHPALRAVLVADSSNHRIQLLDPDSHEVRGVWGGLGDADGRFMSPLSLCVDTDGDVYVADTGNRRVQKLSRHGRVAPGYRRTLQAALPEQIRPTAVSTRQVDGRTEVFILDARQKRILVTDAEGELLGVFGDAMLGRPMGLAAAADGVYVGDNGYRPTAAIDRGPEQPVRRILRFKRTAGGGSEPASWVLVGEAVGFEGPVAALALDGRGGLWVHPGNDPTGDCRAEEVLTPLRLLSEGGYAAVGVAMLTVPLENPSYRREQWHRIRATTYERPSETHFQIAVGRETTADPASSTSAAAAIPRRTASSSAGSLARLRGSAAIPASDLGAALDWQPLAEDVPEGMIVGQPGEKLRIAVWMAGQGHTTPAVSQLRVDFDVETLLEHLPAIYRADAPSRDFLARFLSLFESLYHDTHETMSDLPAWIDPNAVPPDYLSWLAGWLALDLADEWNESRKRSAIAQAYDAYRWRGTPEGLRRVLRLWTGAETRIEEPLLNADWWALPVAEEDSRTPADGAGADNAALGFSTMLAPAHPQGAVVGTTAVLDGSRVIEGQEYGAPLFDDVAHQFTVLMYRGSAYSQGLRDEVRDIIERQRPAHTTYHLCVVEPRLRLGVQARIGVDTVVAGPPTPTPIESTDGAGEGLVLAGDPTGRVGRESTIGRTTRLDAGP